MATIGVTLMSSVIHLVKEVKVNNPITGLYRSWGFQEVVAPRLQDIRTRKW